ncbi:hypothetical protein F383_27297 [Gossypium arboreum]|nr:hypothetical protein F383_37589 [Gossypium arboreum]KHG05782.1 hypothetical protein F383_30907 [Gossypium arboreum]KHG12085.1 hypothetical protein F383_18837 [Gossypium arboreum]KHG21791.1 hypothetical protein F383_27297 [Gossypium arboreum]
MSEVRGSAYLK